MKKIIIIITEKTKIYCCGEENFEKKKAFSIVFMV